MKKNSLSTFSKNSIYNSIYAIAAIIVITLLGCESENTLISPDLIEGQVRYSVGEVRSPSSKIVSNGKIYEETQKIDEGKLVAIVNKNKTYLFYTGWKDSTFTLDGSLSEKAVASYIASKVYTEESKNQYNPKIGQISNFQWELPTGLGVDKISGNQYKFSNFKVRWAAVDNSEDIVNIPPKSIFNISLIDFLTSSDIIKTAKNSINSPETANIDYRGLPFKTYGSVMRAWAVPSPLKELLIDKENLKLALESNPELFAKLNVAEFIQILLEGIQNIAGPFEDLICLDVVINPFIELIKNAALDNMMGTELTKQYMKDIGQDIAVQLSACIVKTLVEAGVSGGTINAVNFLLNELLSFAWIGENVIIGGWDSATSKYYAEFDPEPGNQNKLFIEVKPNEDINKYIGNEVSYSIHVYDNSNNPVKDAKVRIFNDITNSYEEKYTGQYGIVSHSIDCSAVGTYFNSFQASKTNFVSSSLEKRKLIVKEKDDDMLKLSCLILPESEQTRNINETVVYTIKVIDSKNKSVENAIVDLYDGVLVKNQQIKTNSQGITSYSLNCTKEGTFFQIFKASKNGYKSSNQESRKVVVNPPSNLIIEVTPTTNQTKTVGESILYNITVKDKGGKTVSGASVRIYDDFLDSYQTRTTNTNGTTSYSFRSKRIGTFTNTFQASKTGYKPSLQIERQLTIIDDDDKTLFIEVTPEDNQTKNIGESANYTITVKDNYGYLVNGANVIIEDDVLSSTQQKTTNSSGIATYTVYCSKIGSFTNKFQATKTEYNSSIQVERQLTIIDKPKKTLIIEVSPIDNQTKNIGESANYTITVKDNYGYLVNGANVIIEDDVLSSTQQKTTNSSGIATYTVYCSKIGSFTNKFQATKTEYNSSLQVERQLTIIDVPKKSLIIEVSPENSQTREIGKYVGYEIKVRDNQGNFVNGANVIIGDDILGSTQQRTTNSNGIVYYEVDCSRTGNFNISFKAEKTGYISSQAIYRNIEVIEPPKKLDVSVSPSVQYLKGGDFYSFNVLVTSGGVPVQGVSIHCTNPFGTSYDGTTGIDGIPSPPISNWRVPGNQQAGNYQICFEATKSGYDYGEACGTINVSVPGSLDLDYNCPPSPENPGQEHIITFTVRDENNVPVPNATITVTLAWYRDRFEDLVTDSNGNATFYGAVPEDKAGVTGIYYFYARKDGYTNSSKYSCVVNVNN